jgi:hypothetical protein
LIFIVPSDIKSEIKEKYMGIYKTKVFSRWANDEGLSDLSLCSAVDEMLSGLIDADLGSSLLKKRVARTGQGKSGGFRTLVATNKGDRWIFVFGFSKNEKSNIDKKEEKALKKLADQLLSMSSEDVAKAQSKNELIKVICNEKIKNS